jgi:hypothetical protein
MTAGQLMEVLRSVDPSTEVLSVDYEDYTLYAYYNKIKKAVVQTKGDAYIIVLVDETSGGTNEEI